MSYTYGNIKEKTTDDIHILSTCTPLPRTPKNGTGHLQIPDSKRGDPWPWLGRLVHFWMKLQLVFLPKHPRVVVTMMSGTAGLHKGTLALQSKKPISHEGGVDTSVPGQRCEPKRERKHSKPTCESTGHGATGRLHRSTDMTGWGVVDDLLGPLEGSEELTGIRSA